MNRVNNLKEILPYVRTFQGATFVIKIGGEVCGEKYLDEIAQQLSLLHHIGIAVVVVHGGGPQMDAWSKRMGIERKVVAGRRITDLETLQAAKMIFAGLISTDLVTALRKQGAPAVGLTGADGYLLTAERRAPIDVQENGKKVKVDFQHVGDITKVNTTLLLGLIEQGLIPVVASLGADDEGNTYNINADTVASKLAIALQAEKYIILTDVAGILRNKDDAKTLVSYADIDALQTMLDKGSITDGMRPKVTTCMDAVKNGVHRTHIIDGTREGTLLQELFVNEGCGTMIVDKKEKKAYEKELK